MKYVIIGGVAAGMSAAMEIVRTDEDAEVTVLERGSDYSYGQCGIPYVIGNVVPDLESLIARDIQTFREKYGIDARIHTEVTAMNPETHTVYAGNLDTEEQVAFYYDKLLIATGADPIRPVAGSRQLDGIHVLKTLADAEGIINDLDENVTHVTVVGGGYIGLEIAENFIRLGLEVTLIQRNEQLAKIFDEDMAAFIHKEAEKHGIQLVLGESVEGFEGEERVEKVLTNHSTFSTDMVLMGVGVKPNTHFLKETGIHRSENGAIRVNAYMETSIPNVYAAGDCAAHYHLVKEMDDYLPLGTTANKQGRIAGANMAGKTITFKGIAGTSILKFFDLILARTGISEKEAREMNIPYETVYSQESSHANYYPGNTALHTKLIYHRETQKLLGGQLIGEEGADKRIDVLATALYNKMTIQQLLDLDLAYAPPYSGVWDALQQTVRKNGLGG